MIFYCLVVLGVLACSVSQILLKKSAITEHDSTIFELLNWRVIVAYSILFLVLVLNIYAMGHGVQLKEMPVLEALGYVFVPVLSFIYFREDYGIQDIISVLFIILGIIIFYL